MSKIRKLLDDVSFVVEPKPPEPGAFGEVLIHAGDRHISLPIMYSDKWPALTDRSGWIIRILLSCSGYEMCEDYLDWCDEYGHDKGAPNLTTFYGDLDRACTGLRLALGEDVYRGLLLEMEIGIAIDRARL